jgi:hypothetical protein
MQPFKHLVYNLPNMVLYQRGVCRHVCLQVAKREIFHGDEERVVGLVPSEELDETFGVLYRTVAR